MRKLRFLGPALLGIVLLATPALAKEDILSAIAVIDVQRVLQESAAAKSVQKQIEDQRVKFQAEIAKEEAELRQTEQELSKARGTVKPDVYADREQKLRQRFLVVERHVQSRRKALDQGFTDSLNVVRKKILDIVNDMATSRGLSLIVVKQQALWNDKKMEITDEVLERVNKELKDVPVTIAPEKEEAEEKVISNAPDVKKIKEK